MQKSRILEDAEMLKNDSIFRGKRAEFVEDAGADKPRLEVPSWRLVELTKRNEMIDALEKRIIQRDIKRGDTIEASEWKSDSMGKMHYREFGKSYPDSTLRFDHLDRSGVLVFDEVRSDGGIVQTYKIDINDLGDLDKVGGK